MNDPREFLKAEYRTRRLRALFWTMAIGLVFSLLLRHFAHPFWMPALLVTAVATLIVRIFYRPNLDTLAVALDEKFNAKNRLEAVDLLANDPSAVARAQREETARSLGKTAARPHTSWFPLTAVLLLVLIALLLSGLSLPFFPSPTPAMAAPKPTPAATPTAAFRWKSPEAEATGTKLEEVPLVAEAESSSGLKDVTLELSVNGEKKKSVPVDEAAKKALLKSGTNKLELSIYLDELNVEPFDVVSYHIQGQRIFEQPLPLTASPIQFIQIRPLREDVKIFKEGKPPLDYALVTALKLAQLQLLKQNFLLTHADIAKTEPAWVEENSTVAEGQKVLADKDHEAIAFLIEKEAPAEVVDLVTQAEPLMRSAAEAIKTMKNEKAVPDQERALALLTAAQKYFMKSMALKTLPGESGKPSPKDPFKDKQKIELPKREDTAAGKLEKLAEKQSELADKLSQPGEDLGKLAKAEREVQEEATKLGEQLDTDVRKELTQAAEAAQSAAAQLSAKDSAAAREPAARATERLRAALAKVLEQGQKSGSQAMDDAQRQLNHTAEDMQRNGAKDSDATEKAKQQLEETARQLEKEAVRQMEQGSATIAKQLQELAKQLRAVDLAKLSTSGSKQGISPDTKPGKDSPGADDGTDPKGNKGTSPKPGDGTGSKDDGKDGSAQGNKPGKDSPGADDGTDPKGNKGTSQKPGDGTGSKDDGKDGSAQGNKPGKDSPGAGDGADPKGNKGTSQKSGDETGFKGEEGSGTTPGATDPNGTTSGGSAPGGTMPGGSGVGNAEQGSGGSGGTRHDEKNKPSAAEKLDALAQKLAEAQAHMTTGRELLERSIQDLQRAKANLDHTGGERGTGGNSDPKDREALRNEMLDTIKATAQRTQAATANPSVQTGASQVKKRVDEIKSHSADDQTVVADLTEPTNALIALISATLLENERDQTIVTGSPEEAPPAYREAVAKYFEQLSRGKAK